MYQCMNLFTESVLPLERDCRIVIRQTKIPGVSDCGVVERLQLIHCWMFHSFRLLSLTGCIMCHDRMYSLYSTIVSYLLGCAKRFQLSWTYVCSSLPPFSSITPEMILGKYMSATVLETDIGLVFGCSKERMTYRARFLLFLSTWDLTVTQTVGFYSLQLQYKKSTGLLAWYSDHDWSTLRFSHVLAMNPTVIIHYGDAIPLSISFDLNACSTKTSILLSTNIHWWTPFCSVYWYMVCLQSRSIIESVYFWANLYGQVEPGVAWYSRPQTW